MEATEEEEEEEEERQVVRRLQRKGIQVPDFHDARAVGVCLAAIQRKVEEKQAEAVSRRQQRAEAAARFSDASGLGPGARPVPLADLEARLRAYEREAERLRTRLRREEVELEVLEEAAPPPLQPGGVEPAQVLARVLATANEALLLRDRLLPQREEEEDGVDDGGGVGPVSDKPVEEARRFVERKLMGDTLCRQPARPAAPAPVSLPRGAADRRRAMMAARSGRARARAAVSVSMYGDDGGDFDDEGEGEEEGEVERPPEALI